jgi:Fumarylacetoacetase N-terminal domain 2
MKLATLRYCTRDGALAVVSGDLTKAVFASEAIAGLATMQRLLDDWVNYVLKVEQVSPELNKTAGGALSPCLD